MKKLKERLSVDDELFCYDGKTQMERVKVISIDKEAKTAKLSNRVICSRYPDTQGYFKKYGSNSDNYNIKRFDDNTELLYKGFKSKQRVRNYITQLNLSIMNQDVLKSPIEDIEKLMKLDKCLTKILGK